MGTQDDIAERVKRYFARQIVWLELQRDELQALPVNLADTELEGIAARQAQREREGAEFAREQQGLLREWQAAAVGGSARAEVQTLAKRAQILMEEVRAAYDAAAARARGVTGAPQESLERLRRGRRMLDSYRPTDPEASDFLDRRA